MTYGVSTTIELDTYKNIHIKSDKKLMNNFNVDTPFMYAKLERDCEFSKTKCFMLLTEFIIYPKKPLLTEKRKKLVISFVQTALLTLKTYTLRQHCTLSFYVTFYFMNLTKLFVPFL